MRHKLLHTKGITGQKGVEGLTQVIVLRGDSED